jgi:hypothetical protein
MYISCGAFPNNRGSGSRTEFYPSKKKTQAKSTYISFGAFSILKVVETDSDSAAISSKEKPGQIHTRYTNTAGLSGADLGNFLIKRVVTELKATAGLGNLSTFVTLSPIPGMSIMKW